MIRQKKNLNSKLLCSLLAFLSVFCVSCQFHYKGDDFNLIEYLQDTTQVKVTYYAYPVDKEQPAAGLTKDQLAPVVRYYDKGIVLNIQKILSDENLMQELQNKNPQKRRPKLLKFYSEFSQIDIDLTDDPETGSYVDTNYYPKNEYTVYVNQWDILHNLEYKVIHKTQNLTSESGEAYSIALTETFKANEGDVISGKQKTFEGFYLKESTQSATLTITPEGPNELTYSYNRNQVELTFDLKGGIYGEDSNPAPVKIKTCYGATVDISRLLPKKSGYKFKGWTLDLNTTPAVIETVPETCPAYNVTYYAVWAASCVINFAYDILGYGQISGNQIPEAINTESGMTITLPVPNIITYNNPSDSKTYVFAGWAETQTAASGITEYYVTETKTLYMIWVEQNTYTVKYLFENITDEAYTENTGYQTTIPGITGQMTAAEELSSVPEGFELAETVTQVVIVENNTTVVEIKYKRKQITATFDLNGGTATGYAGNPFSKGKFGSRISFTANNASKTGYSLKGWKLENTIYTPTQITSMNYPAQDITFIAQWEETSFNIPASFENILDETIFFKVEKFINDSFKSNLSSITDGFNVTELSQNACLKISAYKEESSDIITTDIIYNANVLYYGTSITSPNATSGIAVIYPNTNWPLGSYQISITGTYKGQYFSAMFEFVVSES